MNWFAPLWPAPDTVRAIVTTRSMGNLAIHVGDAHDTRVNREALVVDASLPSEPHWMEQVHGDRVIVVESVVAEGVVAESARNMAPPQADAAVTTNPGQPIVVLVADCLPILLCSRVGHRVGVVHAGWRGLASGVIARALEHFAGDEVVAWLGPAIGPCHYEVDDKVWDRFDGDTGFEPQGPGHYSMDLYAIATEQLNTNGVTGIYGRDFCTWCDPRFYSHRENKAGARFAAIIWIEAD